VRISSLALCLVFFHPIGGHAGTGFGHGSLDPDIYEALKYRKTRTVGGVYVGKIRPFYVDGDLFLQPIDARINDRAGCAARNLLRLDGEPTSLEFRNKFDILLKSWVARREVVLIGKGTCTLQGDELIFVVIPQ
jgi:hypothetical protein